MNDQQLIEIINKDEFLDKKESEKIFYNNENFNEKIRIANEKRKQGKKVVLLKEAK